MRYLFATLFVIISHSCFSQISHIKMLVGYTETDVIQYMDSLNSLKTNSYYKIKRDVSTTGDLMLSVEFSLNDESYYTCSSIIVRFQRIGEIEVCSQQSIMGDVSVAHGNLSFIKDNFKQITPGRWEKPFGVDVPAKIIAIFERKDGEYPVYVITYYVKSNK